MVIRFCGDYHRKFSLGNRDYIVHRKQFNLCIISSFISHFKKVDMWTLEKERLVKSLKYKLVSVIYYAITHNTIFWLFISDCIFMAFLSLNNMIT